jgi:hypothetical protein
LPHTNLSLFTFILLYICKQGYKAPDPSVYNKPDDFTDMHDLVTYDTTTLTSVFPHPLPETRGLGWSSMARGPQMDHNPIVSRQMVEDAYYQGDSGLDLAGKLDFCSEALDTIYESYYDDDEQRHETRHTKNTMVHLTLANVNPDLPYLIPPSKIPRTKPAAPAASSRSTKVPSSVAPTNSTTSRRAPRNCQRCKQFGGANATTCTGSKGSFGSKAWYVRRSSCFVIGIGM